MTIEQIKQANNSIECQSLYILNTEVRLWAVSPDTVQIKINGVRIFLSYEQAPALLSTEPMVAITQAEYERLKARIEELETTLEEAMVKDFNLHG